MAEPVVAPAKRVMDRIRKVCLAYPDAWEDAPWGHPVFKVGKKMFCSVGDADGGWGVVCPVGHELQEILLQKKRFYRPSYVGNKGWVGIKLGAKTDWKEVAGIVDIGYRRVALKRQIAKLDASPPRRGRAKDCPEKG